MQTTMRPTLVPLVGAEVADVSAVEDQLQGYGAWNQLGTKFEALANMSNAPTSRGNLARGVQRLCETGTHRFRGSGGCSDPRVRVNPIPDHH